MAKLSTMPQTRTIMHIDMNAFFASVEQSANRYIRNLPVAVGNPKYENTALVAVSYEARRRGVRNLSRGVEAKRICPELIIAPFDPLKYYAVNRQIINIFQEYTPNVEVYSIDEAFLDLTELPRSQQGRHPEEIAIEIKERILAEVGPKLTSSVGIAPNKLLAKVASNWQKPDGLTNIHWEERFNYLDSLALGDIWGIGYNSSPKLAALGFKSTSDLRQADDATLSSIVGGYYTRLRLLANGEHYDPVSPNRSSRPHKSMQHAHTLSEASTNSTELKSIIRKMSERLSIRLRKHKQRCEVVFLGLKPTRVTEGYGWNSPTRFYNVCHIPTTQHGLDIYRAAEELFNQFNLEETPIRLVYVGVGSLDSTNQLLLSNLEEPTKHALDGATDKINQKYGAFTLRSADIVYQYAKERELSVDKTNMVFHPE